MFSKALLNVSFLAGLAFATPTPSSTLEKRGVTCGGVVYSDSQLEACRYPHFFGNREKLNFGSYTGSLYEYPLILGTKAYNGGPPGPDRCVAAFDATTGNCDLLSAMTHTGAPANNRNTFFLCT
ncbi:hypothetical protein COCMIDRAFT_41203 [Bipolaris oryzae ATCC 44560]|uniref:Uncharacterized protein n=1 Tax=Bipolaris oryzae ATCC 44560 TaxID=930090 RepID=W6Z9U6_COCMI|nr:uncharacterized protein COCMIDRAFT_41203 [Bipolaris oryzae ATCC 44560]EUC40481.1 hypothetical protein COCMIDRAFT_41203 [Bipolaris oryzae ATCC 44560]